MIDSRIHVKIWCWQGEWHSYVGTPLYYMLCVLYAFCLISLRYNNYSLTCILQNQSSLKFLFHLTRFSFRWFDSYIIVIIHLSNEGSEKSISSRLKLYFIMECLASSKSGCLLSSISLPHLASSLLFYKLKSQWVRV